jgi:acyl-CoA synthetase (AMP-forming)/AMP-acid ligase II
MASDWDNNHDWANNNVAARLRAIAEKYPDKIAIAVPLGSSKLGTERPYRTLTFTQLELTTSSMAAGFQQLGVKPGMRIALLVRFGAEFISLVFALLKTGAVIVLVDPGMGRKNLIKCLEATQPKGFVAIRRAHVARLIFKRRFPDAKINVTVGRSFGLFPQPTLKQLEGVPSSLFEPPVTTQDSEAAIIFTTGSTGPPKGVLYTHQTFNSQVDAIAEHYNIKPGGCDLSGFPLFGLFNAVMGTTTVIPDMDPTRPADVDARRLLDAIDQWKINQAFGSPALWTAVSQHARQHSRTTPSLKLVLSAGAPVPRHVIQAMREMLPDDAQMHTPYGATEALPIASIESRDVLNATPAVDSVDPVTSGTCVGHKFQKVRWKIIAINDGPLDTIEQTKELPLGQIGELMVTGPAVTRHYVTRVDQNALHKVRDGDLIWHRMGDVGYLDSQERFWFCGRKSHRVITESGTLFTDPCEAVFNQHPQIYRSALIGIGPSGRQVPVIVVEPWREHRPSNSVASEKLTQELKNLARLNGSTASIEHVFIFPQRLPTDIRHNSKIFREQLVPWAERQLQQDRRADHGRR